MLVCVSYLSFTQWQNCEHMGKCNTDSNILDRCEKKSKQKNSCALISFTGAQNSLVWNPEGRKGLCANLFIPLFKNNSTGWPHGVYQYPRAMVALF